MRTPRYAGGFGLPLIFAATMTPALAAESGKWKIDSQLRTVAEQSGYRATASSAFVVEFVKAVSRESDYVDDLTFGATFEGRPMIAAAVARPPLPAEDALRGDKRLIVLINANIHSGECCGKEATLRMLRELARRPNPHWLDRLILLIVPNFNADGNDRVAKDNRPGQVGPIDGMGVRSNAQNYDLNRDYMKLESPEARGLVGLMNRYEPHCFIDLHTTNGSWHRYQLTYDVVHNPAADPLLHEFMRRKMMPAVKEALRMRGVNTFYYGNFNSDNSRWSTADHKPRFGLDYVSLRGRISILSEAYSYIPFQDRIDATYAFVTECLNYLAHQADTVRLTLAEVRENTVRKGADPDPQDRTPIRARATPFAAKVIVQGFNPPRRPRIRRDEVAAGVAPEPPGLPKDFAVDFYGQFKPSLEVSRPFAYLIPPRLRRVIQQLRYHGIGIEWLTSPTELEVEIYRSERISRAAREFQQHRLVTVDAGKRTESRLIAEGTAVVRTAQPLGNLLVYLLEPQSDDGLVTWNFLDDELAEGKDFPIVRLMTRTDLPLEMREE